MQNAKIHKLGLKSFYILLAYLYVLILSTRRTQDRKKKNYFKRRTIRKAMGSGVKDFQLAVRLAAQDFDTLPQATLGPFETKMAASNEKKGSLISGLRILFSLVLAEGFPPVSQKKNTQNIILQTRGIRRLY